MSPKPGRPCTFPSPWLELVEHYGTVEATAQALGASPKTLHEWAHGTRTPTGTARISIDYIFMSARLIPPKQNP
jgi:hypothetical protein